MGLFRIFAWRRHEGQGLSWQPLSLVADPGKCQGRDLVFVVAGKYVTRRPTLTAVRDGHFQGKKENRSFYIHTAVSQDDAHYQQF